MSQNYDDEAVKIKKKKIKEKKEKPKKEKAEKTGAGKVKSKPRAKGVRLDFTEEAPQINRYYMGVSKRYRLARYLSVVVLVVFLVVMLVFYRENITYANLMYLVRDLDSDAQVNVGVYSDISYDRSFVSDYGMFRSRIAVASPTGFTLYSSTGSVDLESDDIVAEPRLEVSEKYALMYGAGEKDYCVYTTLARVLSAECDFEIEDAAVSDSGRYALLTGDDEARFLVTAYSSDFRPILEFHINKFVIDMALDEEGEKVAIVSADVNTSRVNGELMIGSIDKKESKTFDFEGMMPLYCEYTDDGRLVVLFDSCFVIFDGEKELARVDFNGLAPGQFCTEGNILAVAFPTNVIGSEQELRVFDTEGKELYKKEIGAKIVTLATDGKEAVYAVGEGDAFKLSLKDGKLSTEAVREQPLRAIAVPGSLVVFSPDKTTSYFVKEQ